jgi:hypothetical protein
MEFATCPTLERESLNDAEADNDSETQQTITGDKKQNVPES